MDSEETPELLSLRAFYADLDPGVVDAVWDENEHDYPTCMALLAEIAKNPSAAPRRSSGGHQEEPRSPLRPPLSSSVAEVGTSQAAADLARVPSWKRELPPPPPQQADANWDLTTMATALFDWGNTVSDGITGIADNISDFVSDLASAFDAGWDDGQEYTAGHPTSASERNRAVVMAGGMDSQRVNNRRHHPGTANVQQTAKVDWEGEEDEKKDA